MTRLHGDLKGLRRSRVQALERLLTRRSDPRFAIGVSLARELADLAWEIGRNVGLLLDRGGRVLNVVIGDMHGVPVPLDSGEAPAAGRLKGVHFVRTELRGRRDLTDADREILVRHRLDGLLRLLLDEGGEIRWVREARLDPEGIASTGREGTVVRDGEPRRLGALSPEWREEIEALEEECRRLAEGFARTGEGERALLVGLREEGEEGDRERMAELAELARSARFQVAGLSLQRRDGPDPRTLVGSGKVGELCRLSIRNGARILVFDRELTGIQARNLEERTGLEVLDRTELVLRIFERRARTRAARLRVALARLRYQMPKLVQRAHGMSRIGRGSLGGSGTRGKGEPKLELERRGMRNRIHRLETLLEKVARQQRTRARRRRRSGLPVVSLVGYTNAGKSSWMNALTEAEVPAEDLLFATLDTTLRRMRLPAGREVLLSDTVGFLRDLPSGLLDAFRSTLEELRESRLLVHVVDLSAPDWKEREESVDRTLNELGASRVPRLVLYNKADLVDAKAYRPLVEAGGGRMVSVLDRGDRERLRSWIEEALDLEAVA